MPLRLDVRVGKLPTIVIPPDPDPDPTPSFVHGFTIPSVTNSGAWMTTSTAKTLAPVSGQVWTVPPGTYNNLDIRAYVYCPSPGVVFNNCAISGPNVGGAYAQSSYVKADSGALPQLNFCTVGGYRFNTGENTTKFYLNGFDGAVKTYRTVLTDVVDGWKTRYDGGRFVDSLMTDFSYRNDDTDQGADATPPFSSHNDGFQTPGGGNDWLVDGSFINMVYSPRTSLTTPTAQGYPTYKNAHSIFMGSTGGSINITLRDSWIRGGEYGIQVAAQGPGGNTITLDNVGFYPIGNSPVVAVVKSHATVTGTETCYWMDDADTPANRRGQMVVTTGSVADLVETTTGYTVRCNTSVPSFVVGTTVPTASNTGLTSSRASLNVVATEQVHSTANAVYSNTWFQGGAVVNAKGITYTNCSFANLAGTTRAGTVTLNSTGSATFTRCEFVPNAQADRGLPLNGITVTAGGSYVTNRCYFEGCNDGVFGYGTWADNGSLVDYFNFRTNDPFQQNDARHPGWSHNDGFQHRGDGSITLRGTHVNGRFHPTVGSGAAAAGMLADGNPNEHNSHNILINPSIGTAPVTYDIQNCFLQRGENGFLVTGTQRTDNNGIFKNNRLGTNTALSYGNHYTQVAVARSLGTLTQSGNVYWNDPVATPNPALRGTAIPWGFDGSSDYSRYDGAFFRPGVTVPSEANVGLSAPELLTDLMPNNGGTRYVISSANQTITNKTIKAYVRVDATSGTTTLRNCLITAQGLIPSVHSEGASPAGYIALGLVENPGGSALVLEDCELEPEFHQWWINPLRPNGNVTLRRCVLKGGTDAINFPSGSTATCTAEDTVLGPQSFCNVCYDQRTSSPPYWTHNDGVQIQSTGAKFIGRNVTFLGRAENPKGDLSVLTAAGGYADKSWGAALTYSGPTGLASPAFDVDRGWFMRSGVHGQCSVANMGTVGVITNSFAAWAETHLYGTEGLYHFRATTGSSWNITNTRWSAAAGSLTRTLNGTTYTRIEGELLTTATSGMSQIQKTLAGHRPNET